MRSAIKAYFISLINILAGIFAIAGINLRLITFNIPGWKIGIWFLSAFAVYFFLAHVITFVSSERKIRYADAFRIINHGFEEIHYLKRLTNPSKESFIMGFETLCDRVAEVFTFVTGSSCSCCIKIFTTQTNELKYITLCRDRGLGAERKEWDKLTEQKDIKHKIENNTAFSIATSHKYFLSNRLPFMQGYSNSSFELLSNYKRYDGFNPIVALRQWPLPYRSTLVVPIIPTKPSDNHKEEYIIGFFCIDSSKMFVFHKDYDVPIMTGIADGMFNNLVKLKELM